MEAVFRLAEEEEVQEDGQSGQQEYLLWEGDFDARRMALTVVPSILVPPRHWHLVGGLVRMELRIRIPWLASS